MKIYGIFPESGKHSKPFKINWNEKSIKKWNQTKQIINLSITKKIIGT
jgi:hypothetical protein